MLVQEGSASGQAKGRKGRKRVPAGNSKLSLVAEASNDGACELPSPSPSDEWEITRLRRLRLFLGFARGQPFRHEHAKKFWDLAEQGSRRAVPARERIRATAELLQRGLQTTLRGVIYSEGILATHQILVATFGDHFGLPSD